MWALSMLKGHSVGQGSLLQVPQDNQATAAIYAKTGHATHRCCTAVQLPQHSPLCWFHSILLTPAGFIPSCLRPYVSPVPTAMWAAGSFKYTDRPPASANQAQASRRILTDALLPIRKFLSSNCTSQWANCATCPALLRYPHIRHIAAAQNVFLLIRLNAPQHAGLRAAGGSLRPTARSVCAERCLAARSRSPSSIRHQAC